MGVRSRSGGPQPEDAAWLAEQARQDSTVKAAVERIEAVQEHLGREEVERRAKEAGRLYAQRLFLHEHRAAIRALREGRV